MNNPEMLREATEKVLAGLTADESLKYRILQKTASASESESVQKRVFRPVPVLCSVIALLLIAVAALNARQPVDPASPAEMNVFAAGNNETVPPSGNSEIETDSGVFGAMDPDAVVSVQLTGFGIIDNRQQCASLIRILQDSAVPGDSSDLRNTESLVISFSDGTSRSFDVAEPLISGDGCWSCPAFFSLLRETDAR